MNVEMIPGAAALVLMVVGYFLPTLVAGLRGSARVWGVFLVNLLLGVTGIGWGAALIWAVASETRRDRDRRRAVEESILRRPHW